MHKIGIECKNEINLLFEMSWNSTVDDLPLLLSRANGDFSLFLNFAL